jgi:hypothetical protein
MIQTVKPPKPVRVAGILETVFGTLVLGYGSFIYIVEKEIHWGTFLMLLGFFWIVVAVSLYKASKMGRTICLVLSIVRIPTVIGVIFSWLSIYKLYFSQESKDFFNKKSLVNNKLT